MAVYEFRVDGTDDVVEVCMSFDQYCIRVKDDVITLDDGRTAKRVWSAAASQNHRSIATCPGNYPMVSYAAGVHPAQIREQQAVLKAAGVRTTHYTKDGDPVFEDRRHRKEVCEALGLFDRNAGHSDPTPKYRTANVRKYR